MHRLIFALTVLGLLGAVQVGVAPSAGATVFNVTSGADSGPGTFHAAVTAASADGGSPHVIEFSPGLVVTKDTTESYYFGTQPLTINGNGSTITVSGGSPRILTMNTVADVVINDLTMTDTDSVSGSGAVAQNGTGNVTINDSVISDHEGDNGPGAVRGGKAESTLTINRSRFVGNTSALAAGGAINQTGPLVIEDSYFEDNHAPGSSGGAVVGQSDITVRRSFFQGNTALTAAGGVYSQSGGTTTMVTNSTFFDNDTTGTFIAGAALVAGNLQIDQSTFAANDGAATGVSQVSFSSVVNEDHSITRTVLLEPGADDKNCGSSLVRTTGYTYSTDSSCTGTGGPATGDVENGADPLLGQLRDNGGLTPTRFPLNGSPLVDAVPNGDCVQVDDQRGVARPFPAGGACDIGAIEAVFPAHAQSGVSAFYEPTVRWVTSPVNTPQMLSGYPDGSFGQSRNITRGQAARLYYNGAGAPDVSGLPDHGFTDSTLFFEDAITWAKHEGLFDGFDDDTFRPNNPINRGNYIRSLYNLAGAQDVSVLGAHGFTDVSLFYEDAVKWAKARGLANGFDDDTFRQKDNINRGNASRTFYNTAQTPAAWADTMVAPPNMLFKDNRVP